MNCAFKKGETISLGHDSFVIEDIIGRGASSIVYRAKHQDMRTEHLLKEYNPQGIELYRDSIKVLRIKNESEQKRFDEGLARFTAGYELQINLRADAILKNSICNVQHIHEGYGTKFIEMTVFSGKSYDQVTENTLKDLLLRIKAITKTVSRFHSKGYLLLDIKPANIFTIPENLETIMLFDFDSVVSLSDLSNSDNWNPSSTLGWYAPELKDEDCKDYIDDRTDVYSIGMILYYKLTGKPLKTGTKSPQNLNVPLDSTAGPLKDIDSSVLNLLTEILSNTLCFFKYRWHTEKFISKLEELITKLDSLEVASSAPTQSAPTVPKQGQINVDKVEKQLSKLHITILVAAILICVPIFFLCFSSLLFESEEPANGTTDITQSEHLQQIETTDTIPQSTADTQTESNPTNTSEGSNTIPTQGNEETTSPSSPESQNKNVYVIDTIASPTENFRSLIVTNDGVVYYIDGSTISNSSDSVSIDMQSDFDEPLQNGYLAYDPYNDIVYLLSGGSLSIYNITDLSTPVLIMDNAEIILEYISIPTPQIAVLPDGSLLVPADLDGTYKVDPVTKRVTRFNRVYSLQSPYYAKLVGDSILTFCEDSKEAKVIPLTGGQEKHIQLEKDAPYGNAVCSASDSMLFYVDGVGVCQFGVDGTFLTLITQEDIKVKDYQPLDHTNIWAIAANKAGVIAFYDNTLKCIRCISPE